MFVKPFTSEDRSSKNLEAGRSVEIRLVNGTRVDGIVEFISACQNTHTIFISTTPKERAFVKIYSGRKLIELIVYSSDTVTVQKIDTITVTAARKQEVLQTNSPDKLYYYSDEKVNKLVPVAVGDVFDKNGKDFTVLAITKNYGTMFLEDETGSGLQVTHKDQVLIDTFNGFTWGQPTR